MSKNILKNIVNADVPLPEAVTYLDTWNVYGQNLFFCNIKFHLLQGRSIEYVNYSTDQSYLSEIFENVNKGSIKFHNLNIFDWEKPNLWSSLPSEVINLQKLQEKNIIVAIDRLDGALKYLPETKLLRDINVLKQSPNVSQIILYCGKDIVPPSFLSSLTHISSAVITLKSSKNIRSICDLYWKKRTGKITKSTEEFTINKNLELEYLRAVKSDNKIAEAESELCFQTTFNLKLTEDQKRAKNNLILPHTRVQNSGAQIHYIPDKEDDWDDEDPDEDLCEI